MVWRPIQRLFNVLLNMGATAWSLREKQNAALDAWGVRRRGLPLIAGHTHRPVFRAVAKSAWSAGRTTRTAPACASWHGHR